MIIVTDRGKNDFFLNLEQIKNYSKSHTYYAMLHIDIPNILFFEQTTRSTY